MKKTLLILAAVFGFAAIACAQPKAVGLRAGSPAIAASYENYVNGDDFLEFELGFSDGTDKIFVDGVYNFMILQPDWTTSGSWGFYGGPGAGVKIADKPDGNVVYAGIVGNLGLEYTFDFPLQISLDIRPRVMIGDGEVDTDDIFTFGLGVRYCF